MGVVSLAVAQGPARFSKLLVIKELKPELVDDPGFLEMFLEEARLAARLNHPNIVQTYEIASEGKRHFMVMDYLEGVPLSSILRKRDPSFTTAMQLRVLCEMLAALDYAHALKDFDGTPLGIVHRDATPQNVFVTFDGTVKLLDFGIASALDSAVETRAGVLKGKPAYMPPEQIAGEADARADVYAVGVMLWEAVVGRPMWQKKTDVEILTCIIKGELPTLKAAKPDAPEELIRICDRAMAKSLDDRYPSAASLQADLEAYLSSSKTDISTREVGKVVSLLFAKERATTRSVVEQHIASLKAGKTVDKLPSLPPAAGEIVATPSGAQGPLPRLAAPAAAGTPGGTAFAVAAAAAPDPFAKAAADKKKTLVRAGLAAGGAVLALVGGVLALRSDPPSRPAVDPIASASASALPTLIVPATHEVSLRVTPPNARISIEGVPLSNPGKRTCTHGLTVTMHASAAHYRSADREIRCEGDESIEVSLEPEPAAEPSASAAPSAAPIRR